MIINKRVKSMLPVINKNDVRVIKHLYVDSHEVVVTDGMILVRMLVDNDVKMPATKGEPVNTPVLLDVGAVDKAIKNLPNKPNLPCNDYIQITKDGDQLLVSSNAPVASFPVQCEQAAYPDYKNVLPDYRNNNPLKFTLDGKVLKKLCDMAIKHGGITNGITFELPRDGGAVLTSMLKFTIQNDGQDVFTGVITLSRERVEL